MAKGKMTTPDGSIFEGDYADGDVYEGDFVKGEFHGNGEYTHADGRARNGKWEHGEFVK
jgi:hypothetical protein